nr:UTP--glucose-1-phosphate uridylyltransferase [Motilibacter deserti]
MVAEGALSPETNAVTGGVESSRPEDITRLPAPGDAGYEEAHATGLELLRSGTVASVVLNGGMATRFGGVVKGVVEAIDGRSFLELKLAQAHAIGAALAAPAHVAVMNSYATDATTREFVAGLDLPEPLYFSQYVSLRLEADGSLFRDADGRPSLYSPGHGDFLLAFRRSGVLHELQDRGVQYVTVSNVDNLPARLDPVVLGVHMLQGKPMTAEVVQNKGDVGGSPARVDGRLQIVEGMRFPAGFDASKLPFTNVNTVTFDLEALDQDFELTWLYVEKQVEGRTAVQLERLYHEASAFLDTTYLEVPAVGPRGRFLPIKTPADLEAAQGPLRELIDRPPLS